MSLIKTTTDGRNVNDHQNYRQKKPVSELFGMFDKHKRKKSISIEQMNIDIEKEAIKQFKLTI